MIIEMLGHSLFSHLMWLLAEESFTEFSNYESFI